MRFVYKLSVLIALTALVQHGIDAIRTDPAELRLAWGIAMAHVRGVPLDAPEVLDLAEPLLITCARPISGN